MAIIEKTYPYEILIRFSEGAEHQMTKFGQLEGAHLIERTRLIDEDTGAIVGTPNGKEMDRAQPLDADKVAAYLGERFVDLERQISTLKKELADTTNAANAAASSNAEQIARLTSENQMLSARLQAVAAALPAVSAALQSS